MTPAQTLLLALVLAQDPNPPPAPAATTVKPYNLGFPIEDLRLPDLEGKERALFAENEGKALVLVFWSYRDPVSRFYVAQLAGLRDKLSDRIALYLVESNHDELVINGDALAKLREVVKADEITLPILLDRDNRIADDFDARNNAQAFLIDANHVLRYKGGIDDDPRGDRRKRGVPVLPLLETAIDSVLRGEKPENHWTMASGRPIKRVPKNRSPDEGGAPR